MLIQNGGSLTQLWITDLNKNDKWERSKLEWIGAEYVILVL